MSKTRGKKTDHDETPDWEAIEVDYFAGMSYRDLADKHGTPHSTIQDYKIKNGWARDGKSLKRALVEQRLAEGDPVHGTVHVDDSEIALSTPEARAAARDRIEAQANKDVTMMLRMKSAVELLVTRIEVVGPKTDNAKAIAALSTALKINLDTYMKIQGLEPAAEESLSDKHRNILSRVFGSDRPS